MLKKFFLNVLTSFVGAWIAIALFGVVAFLVVIGIGVKLLPGNDDAEKIGKNSVLVINLSGAIEEVESDPNMDLSTVVSGKIERPQTLHTLVNAISGATDDKNIKAIYLKCNGVSAAPATLNALRQELSKFRARDGKKIIAYGDSYSTADYYVASVANEVVMNPAGMFDMHGIGGVSIYYKDLLDKIGVNFQVVKVGTFKSAVEPYIMNEMSDPARAQLDTLYNYMWEQMLVGINARRSSLSPEHVNSMVDSILFTMPAQEILEKKFVDRLEYERKMDDIIAEMIGTDKKKVNFISVPTVAPVSNIDANYSSNRQIAVLYACGEILDGGGKNVIDYKWMVPLISELAEDDDVKGMVLRVNSPGGSAFGSEQIGEALDYFQSKGKPLAVSMGDYAASGGYWISCGADHIFANPMTITGSIGIFGLIPNCAGLAKMIGVTPQMVSTNPDANFPNPFFPMNERQLGAMQKYINHGYDTFVARVAKGRDLPETEVRRIGEGRVWNALKAKEIGLVDEFGDMGDAVEWVADKADIHGKYATVYYPQKNMSVWDYIPSDIEIKLGKMIEMNVPDGLDKAAMDLAVKLINRNPVQARMPYFDVRLGKETKI